MNHTTARRFASVGIIWVNHHHLVRYTRAADALVIWSNLLLLFVVSLVPFFTAYMAGNSMRPFSTALYAASFLLVTLAFTLFQRSVARQLDDPGLIAKDRGAVRRNWIAAVLYAIAVPAAYVRPAIALGIILANALLYVVPDAFKAAARR